MSRVRQLRFSVGAALIGMAVLRCGGDTVAPPEPAALEMVAGNGQSGPVGQALPQPLVVRVLDPDGAPVAGATVRWSVQEGGSVSAESVETGSDGRASVEWLLGSSPGEQTATAEATGLEGSPVTFVATAVDGDGPFLVLVTQPSGEAESGVAFAAQPVVQVRDAEGADLAESGLEVTASLVGDAGTLDGSVTRTTDADGRATYTDLAITGPAGEYALRFTAPGAVQTLSSSIAVTVPSADHVLLITTNPPVSALDGEVFDPEVQPVAQVKSAGGDPVEGVEVSVRVASGGGTLEGNTSATTDPQGFARFGDLGIRGTGSHVLELTAGTVSVTSSPIDVAPLPSEARTGKWGQVVSWDIVPLHMNLLPNGKVLAWGRSDVADTMGMPRLWDPASGSPSGLPMIRVDTMLFCAGHALLPDGRLMVAGGHLQDAKGIAVTRFFGADGAVQSGPDMAHGRWYPTLTVLPDERVLTMAGRDERGRVVRTPEIWEGGRWVELPGAGDVEIPYYPRNFVAPDGRVFMAGERIQSRWFDPDASTATGRGRWTVGPSHQWTYNRDYGTAAMYEAGKVLYAGGGGDPNWGDTPDAKADQPTATAEVIDLNAGSPTWRNTAPMSVARRHLNSTILPDGQVLITGGTSGGGFVNLTQGLATKEAEVWDPATGKWTTLAANQVMRIYHSVSLLLPDGTVLHGASGDAMANPTTPMPRETNHEIFSPPYLFKGARPVITSVATSNVTYGQTFTVATPNAAQITEARWIRLGSVTHAFDMGQRANTLEFTPTATGVDITAPANPNLAPPGYYMVFILNRNGVPSEGKIVRVR